MGFDSEILGLPKGTSALLSALIHERTGIFFDNGRSDLLTDKLSPLVIERGFTSFLDYYYLLKYDETAQDEWRNVMNALSVQETYFWREIDHVRALVETIVPQWHAAHGHEPLRIWSAACATGEEPLTIAMALDHAGWFDRAAIEIHASDASSSAIEKARRGVYRERSFRNLSPELRARYFKREGTNASLWRVKEDLHARVSWGVANLIDEQEIAPLASAHVIFCRNVFIYFSERTIGQTVRSFAKFIRPPGYLFVGTSESLLRLTTDFNLVEIDNAFVYVKRPSEV
jgi:chemotaxis protein methyltransferase CheR